jgi:hypothetical protein
MGAGERYEEMISKGAVIGILALIMLAVLGHSVWHTPMVTIGNGIMVLFTGTT